MASAQGDTEASEAVRRVDKVMSLTAKKARLEHELETALQRKDPDPHDAVNAKVHTPPPALRTH